MNQALTLLEASTKMMLRSRGVLFAVVAGSVQIAVFGLLGELRFGFGTERIGFFGFVLPGMAVFLVLYQLQDITVAVAASYRARGILRRLAVTPVSPVLVIAAQALAYVVLGVGAAGLILAVGKLVGGTVAMTLSLLWLAPLVGMAVLTAIATAFAVAGLTPDPQTASNVGQTITFLLFALSGAILPVEALPGPLPQVVPYAVPHTALIDAVRAIVLTGAPITELGGRILIGAGWLAAALLAATLSYRFTDD